jgi:predicted transcriptional regulator
MSKEAQMSIKMESELHDKFMAVAASEHRPAAQIVRDLMRAYIARQELPNAETNLAIEAVEHGEVNTYARADDFYNRMGI